MVWRRLLITPLNALTLALVSLLLPSFLPLHPWNEEVITSSACCRWKHGVIVSCHVSHLLSIFNPAELKVKKHTENVTVVCSPSLLCWCWPHLEFELNNHFCRLIHKSCALSSCLLFVLTVFLALVLSVLTFSLYLLLYLPSSLLPHLSLLALPSCVSSSCFFNLYKLPLH